VIISAALFTLSRIIRMVWNVVGVVVVILAMLYNVGIQLLNSLIESRMVEGEPFDRDRVTLVMDGFIPIIGSKG
jgi:hypothetical protein